MIFSDKTECLMNAAGPIERNILPHLIHITEAAAIASACEVGRGDRKRADFVAVEAMRRMLDHIDIKGTIRIGEGERDEAPMLFIGEEVGTGKGPEVEIAVDPLEGTNLTADNIGGSITVMAMAERGGIFHGPDIYFDKIVVGPEVVRYEKESGKKISIDAAPLENLTIVAEALGKEIDDVSVVVLERERHKHLIKELRSAGAHVALIPDGDLMPGVLTCIGNTGIDMVMGAGGSGEAVLTASAVKCLGGKVTGRLVLPAAANGKTEAEIKKELAEKLPRLEKMGIPENEISKVRDTDDLVPGKDIIFAATAVTEGPLMRAAKIFRNGDARLMTMTIGASGCFRVTESFYMNSKDKKRIFL